MSDKLHALEQREIQIHTSAIRAAIYAARGLRCEHCLPPVIPCDCAPLETVALERYAARSLPCARCAPLTAIGVPERPCGWCVPERLGALLGESDDTEGGSHD